MYKYRKLKPNFLLNIYEKISIFTICAWKMCILSIGVVKLNKVNYFYIAAAITKDAWLGRRLYTLPVATNQRWTAGSSLYRKTHPSLWGLFGVLVTRGFISNSRGIWWFASLYSLRKIKTIVLLLQLIGVVLKHSQLASLTKQNKLFFWDYTTESNK
jgi:hypothetical protein